MTRRARSLVITNAVLLGVLGVVTLAPVAGARQGATRSRGEYTFIGGQIQGGNANAIYVVDSANQELVALRWDDSRKELQGIGYRDLSTDAKAAPGR